MSDRVIRAITDDSGFRVIVALTTETVRGAAQAQRARGDVARSFGELLTGGILIREAMAPRFRVQVILKGAGSSMVADSHPDGTSRGLVRFPGKVTEARSDRPLLQIMRTLANGGVHQGIVEVKSGSMSDALMQYMQESEQIVTTLGVAATLDGDEVTAAGGYLVQLLPEAGRGPLMVMTERLAAFPSMDELLRKSGVTPDAILGELLYAMPFARLEESPLTFACRCSQVGVMTTLATLPRADIEELLREEVLELTCDYCGKAYRVPPAQLRPLLTSS